MLKWFTALLLTILLAGAALAGVPVHAGGKKCPMMGTEDCCETAESPGATPQAYAARLCCSLNCSMPGTTGPTSTTLKGPGATVALASAILPAAHVRLQRALAINLKPARNQHSPPIYLQHLALLI